MKKHSEVKGHEGPVLHSSWSHPQFGSLLATSGIDEKVIIHREGLKDWEKIFTFAEHSSTITCLSFNPKLNSKNALNLAVGYSDGQIYVFSYLNDNWVIQNIKAHNFGVNTISWINSGSSSIARIISGGNDNLIKIWNIKQDGKLEKAATLEKIHDNSIKHIEVTSEESKRLNNTFVSLDIDDLVCIWNTDSSNSSMNIGESIDFKPEVVKFNSEQKPSLITHITWSKDNQYLSISTQESTYLYKKYDGEWIIFSSLNQEGVMVNYYEDN